MPETGADAKAPAWNLTLHPAGALDHNLEIAEHNFCESFSAGEIYDKRHHSNV
jgi:hypothetical protein